MARNAKPSPERSSVGRKRQRPSARPEGWTIQEAIEHTVDGKLLSDWRLAKAAWESYGGTIALLVPGVDPYAVQLSRNVRAADNKVLRAFRDPLLAGYLTGIGRFGSRLKKHSPIPASAWSGLIIRSRSQSIVVENSKEKLEIYDVRIFPRDELPASATFHVNSTEHGGVRPRTTKKYSPVRDEVARVLKAKGLHLSPEGHTFKTIALMIGPMMSDPRRGEAADAALRQAISRHYRAIRRPS
jgi:hypothetical protein